MAGVGSDIYLSSQIHFSINSNYCRAGRMWCAVREGIAVLEEEWRLVGACGPAGKRPMFEGSEP